MYYYRLLCSCIKYIHTLHIKKFVYFIGLFRNFFSVSVLNNYHDFSQEKPKSRYSHGHNNKIVIVVW